MEVLFVEAKRKMDLNVDEIDFSMLPDKIFLAYSIQYKELAEQINKKLGSRIKGFQQVLGCSMLKSRYPILLVGSGRFHALNLALKGNRVYVLEDRIIRLDKKELEKVKGKRKAALSRYYAADKLGILVSYKPGQENLEKAVFLKKKLEKNKEVSLFLADNINIGELENYDIDSWINTSCQALTFNSKVVNIQDLEN